MPRIRCHYNDCVFFDDNYCAAAAVEIDPETGCMTYNSNDDTDIEDDFEDEMDGMEEEDFDEEDLDDDDGEDYS